MSPSSEEEASVSVRGRQSTISVARRVFARDAVSRPSRRRPPRRPAPRAVCRARRASAIRVPVHEGEARGRAPRARGCARSPGARPRRSRAARPRAAARRDVPSSDGIRPSCAPERPDRAGRTGAASAGASRRVRRRPRSRTPGGRRRRRPSRPWASSPRLGEQIGAWVLLRLELLELLERLLRRGVEVGGHRHLHLGEEVTRPFGDSMPRP